MTPADKLVKQMAEGIAQALDDKVFDEKTGEDFVAVLLSEDEALALLWKLGYLGLRHPEVSGVRTVLPNGTFGHWTLAGTWVPDTSTRLRWALGGPTDAPTAV
jgi:hypothetical protein